MRITRVQTRAGVSFAAITDDHAVLLAGAPFADLRLTDDAVSLKEARLLPPVVPGKIVAVGRNYADHVAELDNKAPEQPRIFFKPPTSVVGPGIPIRYPPISDEVHHEAELAVVIGRECRDLTPENALDSVFGYTCANDVTARDIQRSIGLPDYAKSFDTFCPIGPWIETDFDPAGRLVTCTVNGVERQRGSTAEMLWNVPALLSYITAAMTLIPGDIVLTGTPAGVGEIKPGDEVTVTIDGIGELHNTVAN